MTRSTWLPCLVLLASSACTEDETPKCTPMPNACFCASGGPGTLLCGPDGKYSGECMCQGDAVAGTTSGSGGSGTSGTGGAPADDSGTLPEDDGGVMPPPGTDGGTSTTDASAPMTDSGAPGAVAYSGPCTSNGDCPAGEKCVSQGFPTVSYCSKPCSTANECAAAPSGGATPDCAGANPLLSVKGNCALSCNLLSGGCPTGMMCSALLILPGTCVWQ